MRPSVLVAMLAVVPAAYGAVPDYSAKSPACDILNYGLIESTAGETSVPSGSSVTGTYTLAKRAFLSDKTSVVPARLGVYFGVARRLLNFPDGEVAELVISHPPIKRPDGKVSSRTVIPASPQASASGYRFDEPYEVVAGEVAIRVLLQRHFTVQTHIRGRGAMIGTPNPSLNRTARRRRLRAVRSRPVSFVR